MKKCKYCKGYGKVNVFLAEDNEVVKECPICKGKGKVQREKNIDVPFPLWIGK